MTTLGKAAVIRGDARNLPLDDGSVDLIVTSPPYFALRSYQDGGEHYDGQIGSEATPAAFIDALLEVTRECVRVLKPSGSLWVNLGDKYAGQGTVGRPGFSSDQNPIDSNLSAHVGQHPSQPSPYSENESEQTRHLTTSPNVGPLAGMRQGARNGHRRSRPAPASGIPGKSLMGLPWRYALRCIDDLGLILRAEIIWSKPNGLPESVTDRVRRSHETWFHMVKQPRYYSAVDEIREESSGYHRGPVAIAKIPGQKQRAMLHTSNPLGKLPGSVWTIPTQPLRVPAELGVDHFAAFPTEWPKRIIQGWSPPGICTACGEGRRPVAQVESVEDREGRTQRIVDYSLDRAHGPDGRGGERWKQSVAITGYACACPTPDAPTTPATVLDPFGGTGTTALVAKALGRHGITVDMSADYCRLAQWRTNDPAQLAKVLGVEKPPQQIEGQVDLFAALKDGDAA